MSDSIIAQRGRPARLHIGLLGEHPVIFAACLIVWTLSNLDQALFGYAIPGILTEFGLPLQAVGLILTISFVASAALVVAAGIAADRFGNSRTLVALLAASACIVGLQGFAGGVIMLTLLRSLGFGLSAGLSPITNALVVADATPRFRGVATGLLQCGYPLGWLLASLFAAPLLARYGWRSTCYVAFAVIPLALPIYWMVRRARLPAAVAVKPDPGESLGVRTLFTPAYRRQSLATIAIFFLFGGAYAGSAFFFPTFFTQERGYTAAGAASLVGLSNGIAVFGYMAAALVGEFVWTRRNAFVLWCLGGAAALLGLLWLSHDHVQDMWWYGVMAGLFFGSQAVLIVAVSEIFPTPIRATALATCASAPLSLGFAVFPLIVPAMVGAVGWKAGLSIVVVPPLVLAGLVALALPNRRSGLALT